MLSKLNVRPYNNKQQLLFPASIGDYLPNDHLAHVIDEAVDQIDLTPYFKKISPVGNPSYHPALMLKIWFYGYATKTYSSRKIEDKVNTDVAFIYLAGMQKPDFKTISEFRKNNFEELKKTFVDILQICHALGMTQLGTISIDSKVMKANASASRTYTQKQLIEERKEIEKAIQEYLEKAQKTDEEEDAKYGPNNRGTELPESIRDKEQRIKKMKEILKQLKQAEEKLKDSGKEKINLTDTDSQFQKDKTRKIPGYRANIAVDSKSQIIIAYDVTDQQNDSAELIPMIDKVLENVKELQPYRFCDDNNNEKINIVADSGYSSGSNLAKLESEEYKNKIDVYMPDAVSEQNKKGKGGSHKEDPQFDKSKFGYNNEDNTVTCPAGKKLHHIGRSNQRGVIYERYGNFTECKKCQYFGKCTNSYRGRWISISEHQPLIDKMRQKLSTKEGKTIYDFRKITVEPVFGNLAQNLGFREFSIRGKEKVKGEFGLMCSAHNLLKIARFLKTIGKKLKEILNSYYLPQPTSVFNSC